MDRNEKKSVIAGLYGNALEWYDFLLYASFAPLFTEIFFPATASFNSLLATFSVFAVGFLMRPIGGILLGHYADHVGRRKALILSISVMTLATSSIAFLPSFQSAGIIAPILFTLLRLVQGLAVGGELPGSTIFLIEHMLATKKGLAGSLVLSTAFLGIFIGSFTVFLLSDMFTYAYLSQWGWRIAYLIGGSLGIVGIYLRINSVETASFLKTKPTTELPAKIIVTRYRKQLVLTVFFTSIMAMGNYILIAYVTTFLVKSEGYSLRDALIINFIALLILTILIPLMGLLSDYISRKAILLSGLISLSLFIYPIFWLLVGGDWWYALGGEILLSIVLAPLNATVPTTIAEMFPTAIRVSGTSMGYNIGQALFGGTLPLVALTLIQLTDNKFAPAGYVFIWSLIVLLAYRISSTQNSGA